MSHKWKIGEWAWFIEEVRLVVSEVSLPGGRRELLLFSGGETEWVDEGECKHLPACTGWDWQPPKPVEPPEGYRLLREGEVILDGDLWFDQFWDTITKINGFSVVDKAWSPEIHTPIARKIEPKYRPFKDHVEFHPHVERLITRLDCGGKQTDGYWRIIGSDRLGVWGECDRVSYKELLEKFAFITCFEGDKPVTIPCGVKL